MAVGPALILGALVGILHASLYVLIRGSAGGRLPLLADRVRARGVGR